MDTFDLSLQQQLATLGFDGDEAQAYMALLRKPANHTQLSRLTGINRSKMYRIISKLESRGLVARQTDDTGTFLVAADPAHLHTELDAQEHTLRERRQVLGQFQAQLEKLQQQRSQAFAVKTYDGVAGIKQMLWNELHARKQLLALGDGTVEELTQDDYWAMRQRQRQTEVGYRAYSIINNTVELGAVPILAEAGPYRVRRLPESVTKFGHQTVIYNDTVAIYYWSQTHRLGVEIHSKNHANVMRQLFRQYWQLAQPV